MKKSKYTTETIKEMVNARLGGMLYSDIQKHWGAYPSQILSWSKSLGIDLKKSVAKVKRKSRLVLASEANRQEIPRLSDGSLDMVWFREQLEKNNGEGYVLIGRGKSYFTEHISKL